MARRSLARKVRWTNLPLRAKGAVVVAIPVLALLFTVSGFMVSADRTEGVDHQAAEATRHRHITRNLLIAMLDAETAVRGYLLTGREEFLDPYTEAVADATPSLERMTRLLEDDPRYEDALRRIDRLARERLALLIELRSVPSQSRQLVLLSRGLVVRRLLREELDAIVARESAELAEARAGAEAARTMSSVLIAGGLLLGLLGGVLAMGVFSSGVARRIGRLRENTARLAEGAPLRSLPTGEDEIGRLGTSMEETAIRLREAESDRDRFFTLSIDLLCVANFDGYFTRLNPAWEQVLGYSPQDLMGKPFIAFVHPDDRQRTVSETTRLALGNESVSFENRYRRRDGEYRWLLWTARPDPERGLIFAAARDITDRKEAEHDLRQLAIVDELTGLHNRRGFTSLAQHQLEVARRQGTPGAVLYADLDGMKHINDTFGHAEGDRALMDTAEIIRATLRGSDLVARLGGDEFCALLPDCGPGTAEMVMDRLQEAVRTFNSSSDRPFTLALSAGIVPYDPRADSDVEGLIERADRAMYRVKADRRTRSG